MTASAMVNALEDEVAAEEDDDEVVMDKKELQMLVPGVQTRLLLHVSLMVHGFESLQGLPFDRATNAQAPFNVSLDGFFWQEFGV